MEHKRYTSINVVVHNGGIRVILRDKPRRGKGRILGQATVDHLDNLGEAVTGLLRDCGRENTRKEGE